MPADVKRCAWPESHADLLSYHDEEWGRPTTDEHLLFEKICLEGFQSGLSWLTILRKREAFREAFVDFDFEQVACFGDKDVERLLGNAEIVRNRRKIEATIKNAQRACELVESEGSLVDWIWAWAVETPERVETSDGPRIPATTTRSKALAKELKALGWSFVGPTTVYAFMQSEGLTNDHAAYCFAYDACESEREAFLAGRKLRV
ncbi:MAG: DNA-3-methyladenine glycosylase I [Gaiellaceae bacterium]